MNQICITEIQMFVKDVLVSKIQLEKITTEDMIQWPGIEIMDPSISIKFHSYIKKV